MKAPRAWSVAAVVLCVAGFARAAPAARETRRFALVIGNNQPPRADLPRLRYADDDAVRWAVLFDTLGADIEVLAELDDESRQLYGGVVPPMGPPSRAGVDAAVARIAAGIASARASGAHVVFYFIYAGHGDVEDGKGYVALTDAHFTRDDLSAHVLQAVHADTNHVIVDACRASYFLTNRGPGGERRAWQDSYFRPNEASAGNTGFLLASSASGLSHEWEEFQAGIFSHEVRSGLMGPADANGDGLITYRELTGFVRLANRPVRNERFRPQIVSRVPAGGDDVLLDLREAHAGSLAVGPAATAAAPASSHLMLEDRAGIRWVDFHPGAASATRVILPRVSWNGPGFYLRSIATNAEYSVPAGADVNLAQLAPRAPSLLHRGALHDAFTHLFELAFDQAALDALPLDGELSERTSPPVTDLSPSSSGQQIGRRAAFGAVVLGVASLATAGTLAISSAVLHDRAAGADGVRRAQLNQDISTHNRWTAITGIGGAALAAAGLGLLLWRW
jgi:hypothetical protein